MIKTYDQVFNEKLGEMLKGVEFPFAPFSPEFLKEAVRKAMPYHTDGSLQCSIDEYEFVDIWAVKNSKIKADYPLIFVALTAANNTTPQQYDIDTTKWIEWKRIFAKLLNTWYAGTLEYRTEASDCANEAMKAQQKEFEKEQRKINAGKQKLFIPNHK